MLDSGGLQKLIQIAEAQAGGSSPLARPSTFAPGGVVSPPKMGSLSELRSSIGGYPDKPASPSIGAQAPEVNSPPTVCSLRDRLLKEARHERQRCLEVAEAAECRRVASRGVTHAGTQTDPVAFAADVSPSLSQEASSPCTRRSSCPAILDAGFALPPAAARDEDEEQMEAIRTLARLNDLGAQTMETQFVASTLSVQVEQERNQREIVTAKHAAEITAKEAAHDQVICLENELDHREAALQAAQDALDRKTAELAQAQFQIRMLQEANAAPMPATDSVLVDRRCGQLKSQLKDTIHLLDSKDRHISRLLATMQRYGLCVEEELSNNLGLMNCSASERSRGFSSVSTATSMGRLSAF